MIDAPFYSVNEKIYFSKLEAIFDASQKNQDVFWNFYDDMFNAFNWEIEPEESLDELYKQRAQYIRETYDYVVIFCSGGADSTNVLRTFINNNLAVDEIIASAPIEGLRNYNYNTVDTSHHNTMSETKYTQLPLLNEIASKHPKIKITLNDYFTNILEYHPDTWLLKCDDWIHPSSAARYFIGKQKHLVQLAERGIKIALVYGIDKPNILLDEHQNIKIAFSDLAVNVMREPFKEKYLNVENVMFYWDPKNLKCIAKQAHVLTKWVFNTNKTVAKYMFNYLNKPKNFHEYRYNQSKYERAILPCIYPSTYKPSFQAEKPIRYFLGEHDEWFYKHHKDTKVFDMMTSDVKKILNSVPVKYLNAGRNGFKMHSKFYRIGPLFKFIL